MGGERDEILATHESLVRLVRRTDPTGSRSFLIESTDPDGTAAPPLRFEHDRFNDAAQAYGWKLVELMDPAARGTLELLMQVLDCIGRGDADRLAPLMHDDYVHIDRRPIGYEEFGKDGLLEMLRTHPTGSAVWVNQQLHAGTPSGGVGTGGYWMLNFGEWTPYEFGVHLAVFERGLLVRAEVFPEDQVDAAVGQFEALTTQNRL